MSMMVMGTVSMVFVWSGAQAGDSKLLVDSVMIFEPGKAVMLNEVSRPKRWRTDLGEVTADEDATVIEQRHIRDHWENGRTRVAQARIEPSVQSAVRVQTPKPVSPHQHLVIGLNQKPPLHLLFEAKTATGER